MVTLSSTERRKDAQSSCLQRTTIHSPSPLFSPNSQPSKSEWLKKAHTINLCMKKKANGVSSSITPLPFHKREPLFPLWKREGRPLGSWLNSASLFLDKEWVGEAAPPHPCKKRQHTLLSKCERWRNAPNHFEGSKWISSPQCHKNARSFLSK